MSLEQQISKGIMEAMKAKDTVRLSALRNAKKYIIEAKTAGPEIAELPDADVLKIISKLAKQGTDSAAIFSEQNRPDLASEELAQVAVFQEFLPRQLTPEELTAEVKALIAEVGAADSTATAETAVQEGNFDHSQNPLFAVLNPRFAGGASIGAAYKADMAAVYEYLAQPAVRELFPADIMFKWGVKGDDKIDGRFYLYAIKVSTPDGKAPLDGSVVTEATEQYAQRGATAEVSMTMNAEGTQEWSRMTGENIGKCIAIVLDGYVYSAPRVNSKIDKGQSQITGDFTIQEAKDLANVLNSGKVPAPAKIIQDTVVGPSLGQESINAGMISFVIAFILVLLYMGLFYKTAGWMSDVALLTNVFLLMGVLVSFGAVLTLPGIAGQIWFYIE